MKLLVIATCSVALLSACTGQVATQFKNTTEIYENGLAAIGDNKASFANERVPNKLVVGDNRNVDARRIYPLITAGNFDEIVAFNHLLAMDFLRAADDARRLGKYANGILILSAVAYGISDVRGVASSVLNQRLIAGLGLSEGIRYAGPNVSSRAFLAAAEQSSCIARAARRGLETQSGATNLPSAADAAEVWEIMTVVQSDLRHLLVRKHVNLVTLAVGLATPLEFDDSNYSLQRTQQRLRAHKQQAKADKNTLRYKLLECLVEETSGG